MPSSPPATTVAKVVGLYVYPIKACQPISLKKTKLNSAGFYLDRIFCIVDINGDRYNEKQALSQRQLPTLASIKVEFENENRKDVLFIDASKSYQPGKNQNTLWDEHIETILTTYKSRKEVERYAHVAAFEELKENDFNLNIPDMWIPLKKRKKLISMLSKKKLGHLKVN